MFFVICAVIGVIFFILALKCVPQRGKLGKVASVFSWLLVIAAMILGLLSVFASGMVIDDDLMTCFSLYVSTPFFWGAVGLALINLILNIKTSVDKGTAIKYSLCQFVFAVIGSCGLVLFLISLFFGGAGGAKGIISKGANKNHNGFTDEQERAASYAGFNNAYEAAQAGAKWDDNSKDWLR